MDIKKLAPWNWFKKEEEDAGKTVPVQHRLAQERSYPLHSPLHQIHHEFDRMFDHMFRSMGWQPSNLDMTLFPKLSDGLLKPTLDIGSTDNEYTIAVEVPGVDIKDVKLELVDNTLTIRGEKKQQREEKDKNYYCVERSYGSFQRVLSLPEDVDHDQIKATFRKGLLNIHMPRKMVAGSDVKRIEIKSAA